MSKASPLNLLYDEQSQVFLQQHRDMLNAGMYVNFFSHIQGDMNRFKHYALALTEDETIISINPMQGGALKQFCQLTEQTCQIHYFEENPLLYMDVCKNLIVWQIENNVKPMCAGIAEQSGMFALTHNGGSGHYTSGEITALDAIARDNISQANYCFRLDDYLVQQGIVPTLIECGRPNMAHNIVHGGRDIIEKYHPRLMLVDSPFSNLPAMLKQLQPDYRIFYCEYGLRNVGVYYATTDEISGVNGDKCQGALHA